MENSGRPNRKRLIFAALVALSLLLLIGFIAARQIAPFSNYPAGTPLLYDDFEFVATRAEKTRQMGSRTAPPGKTFVIVDIRLNNKAKRVDFTFKPEDVTPYTVDGKALPRDLDAQGVLDSLVTALGAKVKTTLVAGDSETYRLVFLGPADITQVNVRIGFGAVGSFLDNIFIGRRQVTVPVESNGLQG